MNYIKSIDGLRGIAVLAVLIYHFFPSLASGGFLGVDLFFVVSGFVITNLLSRGSIDSPKKYLDFFVNRLWRLYPSLFVVVLITWVSFSFIWPDSLSYLLTESSLSSLLFYSNIFFGSQGGYFDITTEFLPLLHTWSLSVEWQFYLFFPFLFSKPFFGKRYQIVLIAVITCISLYLCLELWGSRPTLNFYGIQSRIWQLGLGALTFFLVERLLDNRMVFTWGFWAGLFVSLNTLILIFYFAYFDANVPSPSHFTLPFVLCVCFLLVLVSLFDDQISAATPSFLHYIGKISYSLYLVHYPLVSYIRYYDLGFQYALIFMVTSIGFAIALHNFVEHRFRKGLTRRHIIMVPLALMISVFLYSSKDNINVPSSSMGYEIYVKEEFDNRLLLSKPLKSSPESEILVIGDSFAQDFVNILVNTTNGQKLKIDTFYIASWCGNLNVPRDVLASFNPRLDKVEECLSAPNYKNLTGLQNYQHIILASNWQPWQVPLMEESIRNISKNSNAVITVVGNKSFGKVNPFILESLPIEQRLRAHNLPSPDAEKINLELEHLVNKLGIIKFINPNNFFCENNSCQLFDEEGRLLSYDGGHLTKDGAIFLSQKMDGTIQKILGH